MKSKQYKFTTNDIANAALLPYAMTRRDIRCKVFNPESLLSVARYVVSARLRLERWVD